MVLGDLTGTCKKIKLDHPLIRYTRINTKQIKDWNISCDTIKALGERIGRKISDVPPINIFTNISSRAREIRERIKKWDYIKLKTFCMAKEIISKIKRNQSYGKTYLPMIPRTRVLSPKYIKNSHNSTPGKQTTQLKNGHRTWTDTSPRRIYWWPIDIWKYV